MGMKGSQTSGDLVIPKGIVVAFPIVNDVVQADGIDLGYCMETDLSVTETKKSRFTARDSSLAKIYEKVTKTDYSIPITCISNNPDNFMVLFRGERGTYTQAVGSYSPVSITAVYVDADTFTVTDDKTGDFVAGTKVKCNCGVDGYKYGVVEDSTYGAPNTTVNLTAASDDLTSNLTSVEWDSDKITAPSVLNRAVRMSKQSVSIIELAYDGGTAAFNIGSTVTGGTSNATGIIAWVTGTVTEGTLQLVNVTGTFQDDEVLADDGGAPGAAVAQGTASTTYDIVLTNEAGNIRYTLNTDYGINCDSGFLYFIDGGAISISAVLTGYYDYAAISDAVIKQGDSAVYEYEIWIIPQNEEGPKIEFVFWKCSVSSDTTLKLITEADTDATLSMVFAPLADGPGASSEYPIFRQRFLS